MQGQSFSTRLPFTLNLRGRLVSFDKPLVMGILNITTDSFYEGSRIEGESTLLSRAEEMLQSGASILDIGAQSTRPGATFISAEDEAKRVVPAIRTIARNFPEAVLSCDTFFSQVARQAVEGGAAIINDTSAGSLDEQMFETIARLGVPYILMHMQGTPQTMQANPKYNDVVSDILLFLSEKIIELRKKGVNDILIDPGFGFGKTLEHNYTLLNRLHELSIFSCPIVAGLSRKQMIQKVAGVSADGALNATTAANMIALMNGAGILRVHDVKEATETVNIFVASQNEAL